MGRAAWTTASVLAVLVTACSGGVSQGSVSSAVGTVSSTAASTFVAYLSAPK